MREIDVTPIVENRDQFIKWDEAKALVYVRDNPLFARSKAMLESVRVFCAETDMFEREYLWESDYLALQICVMEVVMFDVRNMLRDGQTLEPGVIVKEYPDYITQVDEPGNKQYGRWLIHLYD